MKKDEFVQKINEAGLGGKVFVKPTNYTGGPHFLGCFNNGEQWVVYENDEKGKHDDLLRTTSEEESFQYLFDYMIGKFISVKSIRIVQKHQDISETDDNMTFDEKILAYEENNKDKMLSEIAQLIIEAYNGSYKPHLIQNLGGVTTKHTPEGYSLLRTEQEHLPIPKTYVGATDEKISDYIHHAFLVLGKTSIKWKDVCESDAVTQALEKYFGIKVDLSYTGYYAASKSDVATHPTIWAAIDLKANPDAWATMEEKGFDYFDRNIWMIEL